MRCRKRMIVDETNNLRYFIGRAQPSGSGALATSNRHFVQCGSDVCVGRELYIEDICITYYVMPTSPHGVRILLDAKNIPSSLMESLCKANRVVYKRTYSHFFELYERGCAEDFRSAALVRIDNIFHCRCKNWAFVRDIEGISPLSSQGRFIKEKVRDLASSAISVINEIRLSKLDLFDKIEVAGNRFVSILDDVIDLLNAVDKITTVCGALGHENKNVNPD